MSADHRLWGGCRKFVPSIALRALEGWLGLWWVLSVIGCGVPVRDLVVPVQGRTGVPSAYDDRRWATVLRENVRGDRVDYGHLAAHRGPLDSYLAMLARFGPTLTPEMFPTGSARVCYYINAYNAVVLAAVLDAGVPEDVHGVLRGSVDRRYRLVVDGRARTPAELCELAIEASGGDMRVTFAMCDAAVGSPPLHGQPIRPGGLATTLDELAERAMDNPRIVSIDHEHQFLLLSTLLSTRREAFLRDYRRRTGATDGTMLNVVLRFAGPVRRQWLNTAVGYSERIIPFDRRLNAAEPATQDEP